MSLRFACCGSAALMTDVEGRVGAILRFGPMQTGKDAVLSLPAAVFNAFPNCGSLFGPMWTRVSRLRSQSLSRFHPFRGSVEGLQQDCSRPLTSPRHSDPAHFKGGACSVNPSPLSPALPQHAHTHPKCSKAGSARLDRGIRESNQWQIS